MFYNPKRESEPLQRQWSAHQESVCTYAAEQLIFLDEMGAVFNVSLDYAPKGQRVYDEKPTAKGERISTLGVLSLQGLVTGMRFEDTLNGSVFLYFLEQFLCPPLKPGQCVILDNAAAYKAEGGAEPMSKLALDSFTCLPIFQILTPLK